VRLGQANPTPPGHPTALGWSLLLGVAPCLPDVGAKPATIGHGDSFAACPCADFAGCRLRRAGSRCRRRFDRVAAAPFGKGEFGAGPCAGGGEVAVGPFLGELAASLKTIGTLGQRICSSASPSATTAGRTQSSLKTCE
jgi:hypothetical protein